MRVHPRCGSAALRRGDINVGAHEQRCMKPGHGEPFKDCPNCPEMVVVPAGRFMMGASASDEVATEHEDQVLVSIVRPFAVGHFAVTKSEFAAVVAATDRFRCR
jgi:formylglycine-generating enzyme required for sulfatase activity